MKSKTNDSRVLRRRALSHPADKVGDGQQDGGIMTNRPPVHISVVLDRSGSMASIADDVVGGFNTFLDEQRKEDGGGRVTLVQFDGQDPFEVLIDGQDLGKVPDLDPGRYIPIDPGRQAPPLFEFGIISRIS